jgi:Cu/Ag efflux protein CusF
VLVPLIVVAVVFIVWFASHSARRVEVKRYGMTGTVGQVQPADQMVEVHNDEIPGFMTPMKMDYLVKDTHILAKLKPGDHIKATLVSDGQNTWELQEIVITQAATSAPADNSPASAQTPPNQK